MQGYSRRVEKHGLLVREIIGNKVELALMENHLIAPAAPNRRRSGEITILTEREISDGALSAERLDTPSGAELVELICNSISYSQECYIWTDLAHLTHYLMAKIQPRAAGERSQRDLGMQTQMHLGDISAGDACQYIADPYPLPPRKRCFTDLA